ncbi:DUF1826 domain-containing protein [Marinomonas hwangdonensis]|uniref:DUF1826 domain-containing protein n=1 Tax=Marinomonas hwangdonensis TaxID=1053647 RepID=A0A3M8Q6B3_9GAMM|nr:DUF1826 domain-containing protein [Marinomonas hwangdonensis]RNF50470.1 DUF1826 domain-containing protein [Marinomonas hwangdonensis]
MVYQDSLARFSVMGVAKSPDQGVLADIYQNGIAMAIWQRPLGELAEYVASLVTLTPQFSFQAQGDTEKTRALLNRVLPDAAGKETFIDDVVLLVDMFACLFDLNEVGVRLNVLSRTMCPRFHVDKIPCRLVSTYLGNGSEWLHDAHVDRRFVGQIDRSADHSSGLRKNGQINRLKVGDVAVMKGDTWPALEGRGVVHRSPAANADNMRVFLSLDMV